MLGLRDSILEEERSDLGRGEGASAWSCVREAGKTFLGYERFVRRKTAAPMNVAFRGRRARPPGARGSSWRSLPSSRCSSIRRRKRGSPERLWR
jgi:hypothetical protein